MCQWLHELFLLLLPQTKRLPMSKKDTKRAKILIIREHLQNFDHFNGGFWLPPLHHRLSGVSLTIN